MQEAIYNALVSRQSVPLLQEPAPDTVQLRQLIAAAITAPDHQKLKPWHFTIFTGSALVKLGQDFLAAALQHDSVMDATTQTRTANMPLRAPMVVMATILPIDHAKVPRDEQVLSLGAAIENFLLAAEALGFSAMWRTGYLAQSLYLKQQLNLPEATIIGGFIYIGTAVKPKLARPLSDPTDFIQYAE